MLFHALFGVSLSLILGASVGAQREMRRQQEHKRDVAGFRTFSLTGVLGFVIGFLALLVEFELAVFLSFFLFFGFLTLIYGIFFARNIHQKEFSLITFVSLLIVFLVGILIAYEQYYLSIFLTLVVTTTLFLGEKLHHFAEKLSTMEVFASLKFALISVVILPLLPNYNYSLAEMGTLTQFLVSFGFSYEVLSQFDIFNPFTIWLIVVLISSIAYLGYILIKLLGSTRGILVTGFLGGLMSSTALTTAFSLQSRKAKVLSIPLAVGMIIACSIMFFRILVAALIIAPELFFELIISMVAMGITGCAGALYIYYRSSLDHPAHVNLNSPFSLKPAMLFTLFFVAISFLATLTMVVYGSQGIYFLAFVSGFADVDAITISLALLAQSGELSNSVAALGIVIAAFSNTLVKVGIAWMIGSKTFAMEILKVFSVVFLVGFLTLLLI